MTMPAKGEKVVVCVFFVVSMASLTFGGPINDVLSGLSAEDNVNNVIHAIDRWG